MDEVSKISDREFGYLRLANIACKEKKGAYEICLHRHAEILASWEMEVRRQFPELRDRESFFLLGSAPALLDRITNSLGEARVVGDFSTPFTTPNSRSRLTFHSLEQISVEYNLLRKVIFSVLEREIVLSPADRELILDILYESSSRTHLELSQVQKEKELHSLREAEVSEERYLDLVNHLSHAIAWIADAESRRFAFVARRAVPLLGYPLCQWLGDVNFIKNHMPPEDYAILEQAFADCFSSGREQNLEHRLVASDGRELWFQTSFQLERDEWGAPYCFRGFCFEITQRKRVEAENLRLLALSKHDLIRLREEREMRDRFVATLTHDLRNPLAVAKLTAQLMEMEENTESVRSKSRRIIQSVNRIDRMVQDLLDANRIRAGKRLPLRVSCVNLGNLATEVVTELRLVYGSRLRLSVQDEVEGQWSSDGLRRVIENLVNNGIKYGSKDRPVTVGVSRKKNRAVLSVHNEGNEIALADQAQLFEPFYRSHEADCGEEIGWGIGLTLVGGIAAAHDGFLRVQSGTGNGTTFFVELPASKQE